MDYKIAIKLKEAGFPQYENEIVSADIVAATKKIESNLGLSIILHKKDHRTFVLSVRGYPSTKPDYFDQGDFWPSYVFSKVYLNSEIGKKETFYCPSLEELINACGENFYSLFRKDNNRFIAFDNFSNVTSREWTAGLKHYDSPEEAVANLWLAINKKNE